MALRHHQSHSVTNCLILMHSYQLSSTIINIINYHQLSSTILNYQYLYWGYATLPDLRFKWHSVTSEVCSSASSWRWHLVPKPSPDQLTILTALLWPCEGSSNAMQTCHTSQHVTTRHNIQHRIRQNTTGYDRSSEYSEYSGTYLAPFGSSFVVVFCD